MVGRILNCIFFIHVAAGTHACPFLLGFFTLFANFATTRKGGCKTSTTVTVFYYRAGLLQADEGITANLQAKAQLASQKILNRPK